MRVIAGEFRSRRLKTLEGLDTRPTPDRLRESLFSILAAEIEDTVFIDAYAGTGAVGIEALSRGAARAIFIERSKAAAIVIRENLASLGLQSRAEILVGRVLQHLGKFRADIVFLDPPYSLQEEYCYSLETLGENPPGLAIAQHSSRLLLQDQYGSLRRTRVVRQGENALSIFRP